MRRRSPILLLLPLVLAHGAAAAVDSPCRYVGTVAHCEGRNLTALPAGLSFNTTALLLHGSRLQRLALDRLRRLPRLGRLDCSGAGVTSVSGAGLTLPALRQLDLSHNGLSAVTESMFRSLAALRELDLSHNRVSLVADTGLVLPRLTALNMSHNRLSSLSRFTLIDLTELRQLDLSHNELQHLARGPLVGTRELTLLDLSHNRLSRLSTDALRSLRVQTLDLSANVFRRLPTAALMALKWAAVLDLSGSPLPQLETGALRKLSVREVRLRVAPELRQLSRSSVSELPQLERLDLSGSPRLQFVHPQFCRRVPRLRHLLLTDCALLTLAAPPGTPSAMRVSLGGNPLRCDCSVRWLWRSGAPELSCTDRPPERCAPFVLPLQERQLTAQLGDTTRLACAATGLPAPQLDWTLPGGGLLADGVCRRRACLRDGTLVLLYLHAEDSGVYTCTAHSELGTARRAVHLHVRAPHVTLVPVSVTSTFVTVSWEVRGGSVDTILLQQEAGYSGGNTSYLVTSAGVPPQSFTFSRLRPAHNYTFRLGLRRRQHVIGLSSLRVTTAPAGFLRRRGRRRSYVSLLAVAAPAGLLLLVCLTAAGCRLLARPRRRAGGGQGSLLSPTSTGSDVAFLSAAQTAAAAQRDQEPPETPDSPTAPAGTHSAAGYVSLPQLTGDGRDV
ncbi:leucine-rich repeat neuronal protein 2-like [Amphibalanus amphitrite]|uniref:leucine-rich repeat neuronal protein 2-like n=1 Tax=Amphibalanus amphitrite TaxID=1232801 RepID=UPI001C90057D|nr:leucine-rich repeat neuronal protein 2-like [Amphibalanus amphitrite]